MHADLFANEGGFTPRPAWQVIEAARRQVLTGELTLATTPTTHVYLRDGQVYFAERSTDGGLGVRLLVEGVITRQQMGKGALLVSGVEHLGRMFQRDTTIDRQSVELCVELMTDDVLTSIANDMIDHYTMTMYKRHPNGIDRWLPNRIEVITHVVDAARLAEPDAVITPNTGVRLHSDVAATVAPIVERAAESAVAPAAEPIIEPAPSAHSEVAPETVAEHHLEAVAAPAAVAEHLPKAADTVTHPAPVDVPVPVMVTPPPVLAEEPAGRASIATPPVAAELPAPSPVGNAWQTITSEQPATAPLLTLESSPASARPDPSPLTAEAPSAQPAMTFDSGITLAQSAVDAIMSTAIADEVAEAVRRALAAIDATSNA
ncbi:MAG: hypothetical protein WCC60_14190 [Ilumatobacteraceae bacterium]